jgi:hypothetical protein
MQIIRKIDRPHYLVVAEFADSSLLFPLPQKSTLEDLAERLASLGHSRGGMPLRVEVTIGA